MCSTIDKLINSITTMSAPRVYSVFFPHYLVADLHVGSLHYTCGCPSSLEAMTRGRWIIKVRLRYRNDLTWWSHMVRFMNRWSQLRTYSHYNVLKMLYGGLGLHLIISCMITSRSRQTRFQHDISRNDGLESCHTPSSNLFRLVWAFHSNMDNPFQFSINCKEHLGRKSHLPSAIGAS